MEDNQMSNTVIINNKTYIVPEVSFNTVCDFEGMGINIFSAKDIAKAPLSLTRAIASWIMGVGEQTAGAEIQAHILGGGNPADIQAAFVKAMEESGFLRGMANLVKDE